MADRIDEMVRGAFASLTGEKLEAIMLDDVLVGPGARLNSRDLVALVFDIEDFLQNEYNVEFNWTSDGAMSEARSRLRTVGSLIDFVRERANGGT